MALEFLQAIFGDKALTLSELETALKDNKDIKLGNLAGGAYVGKAKFDEVSTELASAKADLTAYSEEIGKLKAGQADAEKLKTSIAELEKRIAERDEADKKAVFEKNMQERFNNLCGEMKFVNDITKNGIFTEFKTALDDKNNAGKGDKDILSALLKDRPGILANPNPGIDIPGIGSGNAVEAEAFKKMSLLEQMKYAQTNPEEYAKIQKLI